MKLNDWLSQQKGKQTLLEKQLTADKEKLKVLEYKRTLLTEARDVLANVGKATQEQLITYVASMCTLMLQSVFGEEYRLEIDFVVKRNKSEASLKVYKDDIELSLKDEETGGGVIDIVALAMRLSMWSLKSPRSAPVFIMDEPLKNVSKDKLPLVGKVLRELCEKLDLQLVMVSHEDSLIEMADRAYRVLLEGKTSRVEEL
jgi:DNA repair exonuclease SbcCD ATPase subunit